MCIKNGSPLSLGRQLRGLQQSQALCSVSHLHNIRMLLYSFNNGDVFHEHGSRCPLCPRRKTTYNDGICSFYITGHRHFSTVSHTCLLHVDQLIKYRIGFIDSIQPIFLTQITKVFRIKTK